MIAQTPARRHRMLEIDGLLVEDAVSRLIAHALKLNASDLFLLSNESFVSIQVRHLGIVRPLAIVSPDTGRRFMLHIKASAGMDVAERRRPADGRWICQADDGRTIDLRINVVPTLHGEDLGIRLLMRETQLFTLESLGMLPDQYRHFESVLGSSSGLILTTGPSGSGKTATLYAALEHLNDGSRKINTIEDPIEFSLEGLRQSQINANLGLNFAVLLRSVLRQSPDVIMVGEIRDIETAETAVRAANSGHVVFSTLHAPTAAGAAQSLLSLGVHPHFLSTSLRGVVAQRLVRTLCPACRLSYDISHAPHIFDDIRTWLGPDEGGTFYAPRGCDACDGVGYASRTGVFELLNVTRGVRNLIAENAGTRTIHNLAIEEGMLDFRRAALLTVARGITSTEEVFRVMPSEHLIGED